MVRVYGGLFVGVYETSWCFRRSPKGTWLCWRKGEEEKIERERLGEVRDKEEEKERERRRNHQRAYNTSLRLSIKYYCPFWFTWCGRELSICLYVCPTMHAFVLHAIVVVVNS